MCRWNKGKSFVLVLDIPAGHNSAHTVVTTQLFSCRFYRPDEFSKESHRTTENELDFPAREISFKEKKKKYISLFPIKRERERE